MNIRRGGWPEINISDAQSSLSLHPTFEQLVRIQWDEV